MADELGSILVLNAGSSSLKFALFTAGSEREDASGTLETPDPAAAVTEVLAKLPAGRISAVGHRVVHGGAEFRESVPLSSEVRDQIGRLAEIAPLHNPPALAVLEAAEWALPGVPQVAVFDTAFFAALPERAQVYPLPWGWYEQWGVRRFGFHGLSHAYCAERAAQLLSRPAGDVRLVTCHLGQGCSASAIVDGAPVATTMGFTPLEGLMMGSRSGSIDPGILLDALHRMGLGAEELDQTLNHASGLLGVSGLSADFREVEAAARRGHTRAHLAIDMYADRVRAAIGALSVTMGGADALVFTAGVGEHSATLRKAVCEGLECLGLRLDAALNAHAVADADVTVAASRGRIFVVHTREELMIARETRRVVREARGR